MSGTTAKPDPASGQGQPIWRIRDNLTLEDFDLFCGEGERSALIFVYRSGDTHYLEPDDVGVLMRIAKHEAEQSESGLGKAEAKELSAGEAALLRRLGLVRASREAQS